LHAPAVPVPNDERLRRSTWVQPWLIVPASFAEGYGMYISGGILLLIIIIILLILIF
jgi:uncharacterized membrane protein